MKRLLPIMCINANNCFDARLALETDQQRGRSVAAKRHVCWERDDGVA
jgi:hypothetical protein